MTKKEFLKLYKGKAVWCKTEKLANEFLELADGFGVTWGNGKKLTHNTEWGFHKESTCYFVRSYIPSILFCSKEWAINEGCEIIEFKSLKAKIRKEETSLDNSMLIYIEENTREELFNIIYNEERLDVKNLGKQKIKQKYYYYFSAENLERYCQGAISRADYAYSHIRKLLKREYLEWKSSKITKEEDAQPKINDKFGKKNYMLGIK